MCRVARTINPRSDTSTDSMTCVSSVEVGRGGAGADAVGSAPPAVAVALVGVARGVEGRGDCGRVDGVCGRADGVRGRGVVGAVEAGAAWASDTAPRGEATEAAGAPSAPGRDVGGFGLAAIREECADDGRAEAGREGRGTASERKEAAEEGRETGAPAGALAMAACALDTLN